MEKITSKLSFLGGLAIVFLGITLLLIKADTGHAPETLKYIISGLILFTGITTLMNVSKRGLSRD